MTEPVAESFFRNLGPTLVLLRELRGKGQREVAKAAGMSPSELSKYEKGKGLPQLAVIEKLLRTLDLTPIDLFYTIALVDRREAERLTPVPEAGHSVQIGRHSWSDGGLLRRGGCGRIASVGDFMDRLIVRQVLPITALVVLLFIPNQALARPDQGDNRNGEAAGSFWSGWADAFYLLVAAWEDNGASLDPWGKPRVSGAPAGNNVGASLDPFGG